MKEAISLPVKPLELIIFHPFSPHSSLDHETAKFWWSFDF